MTNYDKILEYHIFQPVDSRCGFPLNILQVSYLPSLWQSLALSVSVSLCVCGVCILFSHNKKLTLIPGNIL